MLILGSIALMVLIVFLGIPALVRMAAFLGDVNSAKRPIDKSDIIAPAPPRIILPFEATNSARLVLNGYSEAGATVFLIQNGGSVGNVVAKDDGAFIFSDAALKSGDNSFVAVAVDQAGNRSQQSEAVGVYYSNKTPELTIDSPINGQQVSGNKVEVRGKVKGAERLTINDRLAVIGSEGKFSLILELNSGENGLVVVATDRAGNQTKKELTVTATP